MRWVEGLSFLAALLYLLTGSPLADGATLTTGSFEAPGTTSSPFSTGAPRTALSGSIGTAGVNSSPQEFHIFSPPGCICAPLSEKEQAGRLAPQESGDFGTSTGKTLNDRVNRGANELRGRSIFDKRR